MAAHAFPRAQHTPAPNLVRTNVTVLIITREHNLLISTRRVISYHTFSGLGRYYWTSGLTLRIYTIFQLPINSLRSNASIGDIGAFLGQRGYEAVKLSTCRRKTKLTQTHLSETMGVLLAFCSRISCSTAKRGHLVKSAPNISPTALAVGSNGNQAPRSSHPSKLSEVRIFPS